MKKKISIYLCFIVIFSLVLGQVSFTKNVSAQAIKISKTKLTLSVGKTYTLKITGTTKKVVWSSNNKSIATVSSKGQIKAIKSGTTNVTALVNKKKYICNVTINTSYEQKMASFSVMLLKGIIKNPDSLQINSIHRGNNEDEKNRVEVIIDYSAQNGFGGTNRDIATFFYSDESPDDKYWLYDEEIDKDKKAIRLEMDDKEHILSNNSKLDIDTILEKVGYYEKECDPIIYTPS